MEHLNHYQALGIARDASPEQIRQAYRQAAQVCHPDRAGNDAASVARFQQLTAAYKALRFPALRHAYDAEGGFGTDWKPWYGPLNHVDGIDAIDETTRRANLEGYERIALVLASGGFGAPRIAARLALSGCAYKAAWQIAWQARHQMLQDELDRMFMQERDEQRAALAASGSMTGTTQHGDKRFRDVVDGDAALAFAAANPAHAAPASSPGKSETSASRALALVRRPWRASRPGRIQRLLMKISRVIGFMPARMSRENRKLLRLEYRPPEAPRGH